MRKLPATRLERRGELCWQARIPDLFGLLWHISMASPEYRTGPTGLWGEVCTHHALIPALGIGCSPVIIKGEKELFLDWLSWGIESGAIIFPLKQAPFSGRPCFPLTN